MSNEEIARVLEQIADILEIKGDEFYRIRSYRRAAESINHAPFPITMDTSEDQLRGIPGIGEAMARKTLEIAETGTCAFREDLLTDFPAGLLEVLRVRGVGPKRAALFYREARVNDLITLEEAARSGRLAALKGMGKKSEEAVIEAIDTLRRVSGRTDLATAQEIASGLVGALGGVEKVLPAGSLRRGRETVGDLDLLTTTDNAEAQRLLAEHPSVDKVLLSGETKTSVLLRGGMQVDLRVVPPESFGAALQYFTGSVQHNVRLREIAQTNGLRLNEYGLYDERDADRCVAGESEEGIYEALGLPWIPPELREDAGEIAAAREGRLPKLVTLEDLRGDLHDHSTWTDGANTIAEMASAARAAGWDFIAITDHSRALGVAGGLNEQQVLAQLSEVRAANEAGAGARVLSGIEVDVLASGALDLSDEVLAQLDFVVASVHSAHGQPESVMTARIVGAALSPHVDAIGHLTGRVLGRRDEIRFDFGAVLGACLEGYTALEINCSPDRMDLPDVRARMAAERGVMITLGTDAHAAHHLPNMRFGVTVARRAWLEPRHVLNTRSVDELLAWVGAT